MPLEATMMIIDNSEFMRNGDYPPTRVEAQSDAVTAVFGSKTESNPENTVGIMTSAGKGPEVLVTHTKDLGQILQALHTSSQRVSGQCDIPTSLSVAQLALKHRQNKNLRQRIVVFVGSPLSGAGADEKGMVRLAKKLKKNNVAVDIVCFGDDEGRDANEAVLRAFIDNVISADNSHFVVVPPGPDIISDTLLSSPILREDLPGGGGGSGVASGSGAGGGASNFEFGIDPSLDPELAMALRMSLEEERARQAASSSAPAAAESSTLPTIAESSSAASTPAPEPSLPTQASASAGAFTSHPMEDSDEDEEALLAQALAMSQKPEGDVDMVDASSTSKKESGRQEGGEHAPDDEEMSEEEAIAKAIAMSMQEDQEESTK